MDQREIRSEYAANEELGYEAAFRSKQEPWTIPAPARPEKPSPLLSAAYLILGGLSLVCAGLVVVAVVIGDVR